MNPRHHLDNSTLVGYSAGALPTAFRIVVAAHLDICSTCRAHLMDANRIGGQLLEQQDGAALTPGARDAMLAKLAEPFDVFRPPSMPAAWRNNADRLPEVLWPFFGETYSGLRWNMIVPGMHQIRAEGLQDAQLVLLRTASGRSVPLHSHEGNELTMILRGAYDDALGHFAPGDVADLDQDVEHQPITSPGAPCICLAATDLPLRFSGWWARTLQPLFKL